MLDRRPLARALAALQREGVLPERPVHNDAKIANVLFDEASGEALCVVDLDTVMPGLSAHDFGDLARTTVSDSDEDERELARVGRAPGVPGGAGRAASSRARATR